MSNKYVSRDNLELVLDGLKIGTQADWNENDKTASGYVKNRPFYTDGEEVYQIDEKYIPDSIARARDVANDIAEVSSQKMNAVNPVGTGSFSMGRKANTTIGDYSHAEGYNTTASVRYTHAEGEATTASGQRAHSEGGYSTASGHSTHAEGISTTASGDASHAEGQETIASGWVAHAEGRQTEASGDDSHAEGQETIASGEAAHAEGRQTKASGFRSHAEGGGSIASGGAAHAEGRGTTASGDDSHAEGISTTASGIHSHAEGSDTEASGIHSHAEGYYTRASGDGSHAEGSNTIATHWLQHVQGEYNIIDSSANPGHKRGTYAHIVGNGTITSERSNAHTLDWEGNAWYQGDVYVGSTSGTNRDEGSKKLATEECVYSPKSHFTLIDDTTSYEYIIRMQNGNLASICKASSLAVTTLPTKTTYTVGETLDLTDMVVTLTRQDGATEEVNNYSYTEPDMSVAGTVDVTVSYVEAGETYSATFAVTITEATTTEETETTT